MSHAQTHRRGTLNLELQAHWPGTNPLAVDYLKGEEQALRFYGGWWGDAEAYRAQAERVDARFDPSLRERTARILVEANPAWSDRIETWLERDGYVVTTGQQPGLFTGPLFSVYKALTAVALASRLEGELDRPVLPVFWVASEDHDWEESDHTFLVDTAHELIRVEAAPGTPPDNRPIFRVELAHDYDPARPLIEAFPDNDFRDRCIGQVRAAYSAGCTLASGFATLLRDLLGDRAPVIVQAHQSSLKEASRSVLFAELSAAIDHEQALGATASSLEAAGYPVQVPILQGGVNLFLEGSAGRERLYRDHVGFALRHSGVRLTAEEVRARAQTDPSVLSPNVLLRPVVESSVFPVLSYVAGPGELTYFGETRTLFEAHGLHMPVIHPRAGLTVVEPKVRKVLDKFSLTTQEVGRPAHELATELAKEEMPAEASAALERLQAAVGQGATELSDAVKGIDPTLQGPVAKARNASFSAFAEAEKKILKSLKRENHIALRQIQKARVNLWPNGAPQERTLNVLQFTGRYGGDFLDSVFGLIRAAVESGGASGSEPAS